MELSTQWKALPICRKSSEIMIVAMKMLILFLIVSTAESVSITVATYNLWNVMFNWEVRKHHIAEMIRASNIDVIGFQEVRSDVDPIDRDRRRRTQVDELQQLLLPDYKWSTYQIGHTVIQPQDGGLQEWQLEGLALLSRHPILQSRRQDLSHHSRTDKIGRRVLHVTLLVKGQEVVVSVIHLSYDKWQQCNNIAEIMQYVRDTKPKYSIILGDFNTYNDYEGPLEGLHRGYFSAQNKCPKYAKSKNPTVESELTSYDDVWKVLHYGENGYTFSNMPSPGFESRPDRILVNDRYFKVKSAKVKGFGLEYARAYRDQIKLARRSAIMEAARSSYYGHSGGMCLHDCGPSGSCRCGVCVRGGNENACSVPDCGECSEDAYRNYLVIRMVGGIFALQLCAAFVQIFLCLHRRSAQRGRRTLAKDICQVPLHLSSVSLSSPPSSSSSFHSRLRLYAPFVSRARRSCGRLTLANLCIGLMGMLCLYCMSGSWLEGPLRLVDETLPEELNPSDHLMVVAVVELT